MVPQVRPIVVAVGAQVALESFFLLALDRSVSSEVLDQSVRFAAKRALIPDA